MPTFHAYAASAAKAPFKPYEFDPGDLHPEDVEIKVDYCGICHSDLSMLDNEWGFSSYPIVLGHEASGTVVALGSEVKGLKLGQKVGLGWFSHSCLYCEQCLSGHHNLCPTVESTIVGRQGAFADRVRAQWTWVRPLPEGVDEAKAGPLLCGGITVFAPLVIHDIPPTASVGVIGIGGLGHMALQFANKWGCEVHAFTTSDSKEAEAKKLGAHVVHNTKRDGEFKKIAGSLDLIISTINAPLDVGALLETLKPGGSLHTVGAVPKPLEVPVFPLILGEKSVAASPTGSPSVIDRMLEFCARHKIEPVTEEYPMSKINDAFEHLRAGKARYRIVLKNDIK